ncbi:pimeloyl-ACP methyl ester carboxylesterase/DNA-binding CsgD family transcriptional regulator [Rhodococcus sp. LBL1]|nr:pimeloyl-ACP methyl ester carboxylesterase/DNA-binding CsgD family transcriptional regulator [Rhodococcus sp. LBL1]MDH6682047.1 pimeloyl-ACP methyl ester carboxylesterase/DNA-binding CsgD family transcriptional regulator [Rhodococcus sp. LBL2]
MGQPSSRKAFEPRRPVRFCTTPTGTRIAYTCTGRGQALLVPAAWISHLELLWLDPAYRAFFAPLSAVRTVVQYDRPGCGLSDPWPGAQGLDTDVAVLEALANHLDMARFDLLGISLGAPVSVAFAARFPERVGRLILYGGYADGSHIAAPEVRTAMLGMIRAHWGLGSELLADIFLPDGSAATKAIFARLQRESASPSLAVDLLAQCYEVDVTDLLTKVTAPTLVVHRRGDRAIPYRAGRELAAQISDARLVSLPGSSHFPFVGDAAPIVRAMLEFLGNSPTAPPSVPPAPPSGELTARQLQVAALVAEGMTNRQIAQRLGIEERSAEGHVERIRLRLGVTSRAQIAAWWARRVSPGPATDVEVPD